MAAFGELLGRLDPDPLRRGKQFERICRWFLTHDPVYARELRQVWLWGEWPDRWGADAGIDLVAEDRHGRLWGEAKPVCCSARGCPRFRGTSVAVRWHPGCAHFVIVHDGSDRFGGLALESCAERR